MNRAFIAPILAASLWASSTTTWEMNTHQDFIKGRFEGVSLSRNGRLTLAPQMDSIFASDQPVIWSVARGPDESLYAGTGHRGRVYRIDKSGKSELLWSAEQPEVFAVTVDRKGVVYAATSPDGKVYRIEKGQATEYFAPGARYIWSLAIAPDGALMVGTGDQGKVYRVTGPGASELYYDTQQAHVTALAIDSEGRILAGTEPNGILYRISAKDKAFVLYDANLPEIRAIVPGEDGVIYAAALGGSVAKRANTAAQAQQTGGQNVQVQGATTSTTVTETVAAQAAEIKPPDPAKPQGQTQAAPGQPAQAAALPYAQPIEIPGVEKSAVYKINPDHTVETMWTSQEENAYDLLALSGQLLISTDSQGRILGVSPDRKVTLVLQTNESEATRLLPGENSILAATGNQGRIYRLGERPGTQGAYESPVHDAGTAARWGSLNWRAENPPGSSVVFRTRSGNSLRPDRTWSEWSAPLAAASGSRITSPNARYIQWKAEFTGSNGSTPVVENVSVAYLPQNTPPLLKNISVTTQFTGSAAAKPAAATQSALPSYTVTVTDTGDTTLATSAGTPTQTLSRAAAQQITIVWQAEDPESDRVTYSLFFRGEEERQWKALRQDMPENSYTIEGDVLADGKYYFRVTASDRPSNPPASARDAELTSSPVLIDNTPPVVTAAAPVRKGTRVEVNVEALDAASPLRRCEYSLDAGGWTPLEAADGVIDTQREQFSLTLDKVAPGEHLLVIRVLDSANNTGLAKIVLR
jgi:hypothetical protein